MFNKFLIVLLLFLVAPKAFAQFSGVGDTISGVFVGKETIPDLPVGWKVFVDASDGSSVKIILMFSVWPNEEITETAKKRGNLLSLRYIANLSREDGKIVAKVTFVERSFPDIKIENEPDWELKPEYRIKASGNRQMQMTALAKEIFGNGVGAAKIAALEKIGDEIRAKAIAQKKN